MWRSIVYGCLCLHLLSAACSGGQSPAGHAFHIQTIDGLRTALNSGEPRYVGELFRYEKILEIRENESEPENILCEASSILRTPKGHYLVADRRARCIGRYDETGGYIGSIGGPGHGPGEFQDIGRMFLLEDQLIVTDQSLRRISVFDLEGNFLLSTSYQVSYTTIVPEVYPTPGGGLLLVSFDQTRDYTEGLLGRIATILTAEGDTLSVIRTGLVPFNPYFAGFPHISYEPPGVLAVTTGVEPVVDLYSLEGKHRLRIRIDGLQTEITREDRRRVIEALDRQVAEARRDPDPPEGSTVRPLERARQMRDNVRFAESRAVWESARVDSDGYLWLKIPYVDGTLDRRDPEPRYRLVSPAGEYLGMTAVPAPGSWTQISKGFFMQVEVEPDTGLRIPTVYRMDPVPEGFVFPLRDHP